MSRVIAPGRRLSGRERGGAGAGGLEHVPCNACGGSDFRLRYHGCPDLLHGLPGRFDIVECRGCGLVQLDPRPAPEAMSAYYVPAYAPFSARTSHARGPAWSALRTLAHLPHRARYGANAPPSPPRRGARALDVGCGAGGELRRLASLGWEVFGIEPAPGLAQRVEVELGLEPGRIFEATAQDAAFPEEAFDLVTITHTLEHLHDPAAVLARTRMWLRADGRLRVRVPNFASAERRLFGRMWFGLDVPRHLYHFTPRTLTAALARGGFTVERVAPELIAISMAGSISHVRDTLAGRLGSAPSRPLYLATLPLASVLGGFGWAPALDVLARPA